MVSEDVGSQHRMAYGVCLEEHTAQLKCGVGCVMKYKNQEPVVLAAGKSV